MMSATENSERKEDHKTSSTWSFIPKNAIIVASLLIVVLVAIGVAVIVLFGDGRDDNVHRDKRLVQSHASRWSVQNWNACKKEATKRGFCIRRCTVPDTTPQSANLKVPPLMPATLPSTQITQRRITPHSTRSKRIADNQMTPPKIIMASSDSSSMRLPNNLYPLSYDLILHPHIYCGDPDSFFFNGHVTMLFRCDHKTDVVVLNSKDLTYVDESFSLTHASGPLRILKVLVNERKQLISFHLDQQLQVNEEYQISANFSNRFLSKSYGLFVHVGKKDNETIYQVGSQLQTIHARKIFPCFDEPHFKSVFNVSLIRKSNTASFSNMEIEKVIPLENDLVMDVYGVTPKMPVYLLAFAVGNFTGRSTTVKGTKMTTWARPDLDGQQEYSVRLAAEILSALGEYYDSPFPLKKLDMLCLLHKSGGMEGWGLILMSETILFDKRLHSVEDQIALSRLVTHEIAHMWFGNLVTMSWWDDIWLNEGFAVYVSYQAKTLVQPQSKTFDDLFRSVTEEGMSVDSYKNSNPVYMTVDDFGDIHSIRSEINYAKGACLVKMMVFFLGEAIFQKAMSMYLKKHAYGNANHTDLWCALRGASGQDVEAIMSTWLKQMNFPLVHISKVQKRDNGPTVLELRQQRYLAIPSQRESRKYSSPYGYRWRIPMSVISNSTKFKESKRIMWMSETHDKEMVSLSNALDDNAWILGNPDNNVFCRVNYDESNWRLLIDQLKSDHTVFSTVDRTTIIEDACHLARSGHVSVTICLDVLSYMFSEREYAVWKAAITHLDYFDKMLHQYRNYSRFSAWVASLVGGAYRNLKSDPIKATKMERALIDIVTGYACRYGNQNCLEKMISTFKERMRNESTYIDPNIISHVFCYGIKKGTDKQWSTLYDMLGNVIGTTLETTILKALGCTNQIALLRKYLTLATAIETPRVRASKIIQSVSYNPTGHQIAFNFIRDNSDALRKAFPGYLFRMATDSMTLMSTPSQARQVRAFLIANLSKSLNFRRLLTAYLKLRASIKWLSGNEKMLERWLQTLSMGQ